MLQARDMDDHNYHIYNQYGNNIMAPVGPVGIIPLTGSAVFADSVNYYLCRRRTEYLEIVPDVGNIHPGFIRHDYRIQVNNYRFSSGEGKAVIGNTVRGHDVFILVDVLNFSCTYKM